MKIRVSTFFWTVASFFVVSCGDVSEVFITATNAAPPTHTLAHTATIAAPTDVPPEINVEVTETSLPVSFEAKNVFAFDEMGISIGFNYPEGFNQGTNASVLGVYEPNAPFELPYPQHARILFTAYTNGSESNEASGIRIFRTAEIDALEAGISESIIAVLEGQIDHRTDFPRLAGAGSPDGQVAVINFQNGAGYRYIIDTRGFMASSLRNTYAIYMYQGISNDGKYLISVLIPINLPFLADMVDAPLTTSQEAEVYFNTINERVNAASPNDFEPTLTILDEMIDSIIVIEQ